MKLSFRRIPLHVVSFLSCPGAVFADPPLPDLPKDEGSSQTSSSRPPPQPSSPYDKLAPPLKLLVNKLVDMGFDLGVTSRAAERFGADEKQVTGMWRGE